LIENEDRLCNKFLFEVFMKVCNDPFLAAVVFILGSTIFCEPQSNARVSSAPSKQADATTQRPWKQFDLNHDGKLGKHELTAWEASLAPGVVAKFDRDKDGLWDAQERKIALYALIQPPRVKRDSTDYLRTYDRNGDGKLDESEQQAARIAEKKRDKKSIDAFDSDGDGALNEKERGAMYSAWRQKMRELQEGVFGDALGIAASDSKAR
jgi:hypothetical protein